MKTPWNPVWSQGLLIKHSLLCIKDFNTFRLPMKKIQCCNLQLKCAFNCMCKKGLKPNFPPHIFIIILGHFTGLRNSRLLVNTTAANSIKKPSVIVPFFLLLKRILTSLITGFMALCDAQGHVGTYGQKTIFKPTIERKETQAWYEMTEQDNKQNRDFFRDIQMRP